MTVARTVILKGRPHVDEDGVAAEAIKPGHLVKGVTSIAKHSTAGGAAARTVALEREELGLGVDTTYSGSAGSSADYAVGDTVKVASFAPGDRARMYIASGQNITADGFLESAGDGTLRAYASGVRVARALESVNNTAGPGAAAIRVEIY